MPQDHAGPSPVLTLSEESSTPCPVAAGSWVENQMEDAAEGGMTCAHKCLTEAASLVVVRSWRVRRQGCRRHSVEVSDAGSRITGLPYAQQSSHDEPHYSEQRSQSQTGVLRAWRCRLWLVCTPDTPSAARSAARPAAVSGRASLAAVLTPPRSRPASPAPPSTPPPRARHLHHLSRGAQAG